MRIVGKLGAVFLLLAGARVQLAAEIIDRVVATVDQAVITRFGLELNLRMQAFLDRKAPDFSPPGWRRELERQIDQALLRREVEITRFPQAPLVDAIEVLNQWLASNYRERGAYENALRKMRLTEDDLLQFLQWQITALRFIEFRFRTGVQISSQEIDDYYERTFRRQGPAVREPPPLSAVRSQIERVLIEQATDQAVESWLKEARRSARIKYLTEELP